MAKLPSQAEIEAADRALQPYFLALGRVAHAWNHLHEELGKVFCAVTGLEVHIGMAIWNSLKNDRSQRDTLESAIYSASSDTDWVMQHHGASEGVLYLINQVNDLATKRNDAIRAPCDVPPTGDFEIIPITLFQNQRARSLRGQDILTEFQWYEATANVLRQHAHDVRLALDGRFASWPEKPQLPTRGQAASRG